MAIPMRSPALSPTWRVPKPATSPARACSPMEASRLEIENGKTRVINKIMKALRIAIIIRSTRPGRNGEAVAKWVHEIAQKRSDAEFELVDIKAICKPRLVERFAVQRSGLNILVGRRDIPGRNREHLSSRQREPGFLEDRTTDVIDW